MERPLLLLFLLTVFAVPLAIAACGGGSDSAAPPPAGSSSEEDPAVKVPAGEAMEHEAVVAGDAAAGEPVFQQAGCGNCHTFAAAGSTGALGPNLDDLVPGFKRAVDQITSGGSGMPAFGGNLTEQEIADVAQFVAGSASG